MTIMVLFQFGFIIAGSAASPPLIAVQADHKQPPARRDQGGGRG